MKIKLLILPFLFIHLLVFPNDYPSADKFPFYNQVNQPIKVFPNPATTVFTIKLENTNAGKAELYNILGKKVKEVVLSRSKTAVYIDDLPKGVYLLSVKNNNSVIKTLKLIKQ